MGVGGKIVPGGAGSSCRLGRLCDGCDSLSEKEIKILDGSYGGIWFRIGFLRFFVVAERYHVGMITFFLFG